MSRSKPLGYHTVYIKHFFFHSFQTTKSRPRICGSLVDSLASPAVLEGFLSQKLTRKKLHNSTLYGIKYCFDFIGVETESEDRNTTLQTANRPHWTRENHKFDVIETAQCEPLFWPARNTAPTTTSSNGAQKFNKLKSNHLSFRYKIIEK